MLKTGRILIVEPEDGLRSSIDVRLTEAGHDVAAASDDDGAFCLLREGLDPDVVLAELAAARPEGRLRELAPSAAHVRIDRELLESDNFQPAGNGSLARCTADPGDILERVEEALLDVSKSRVGGTSSDEGDRCLDLARRLANALPRVASAEQRIDLVTESFDAFFGVSGTLVVLRGRDVSEWVEASQGTDPDLAAVISREIARRSGHGRGLRPFLADLEGGGETRSVACLAVRLGEEETDLALVLRTAPAEPHHRESLMNLVGSAMRAASHAEEVERSRSLGAAQAAGLSGLVEMTREFSGVTHPRALADRVLTIIRREVDMSRGALFFPRDDGGGLFDLVASMGFSPTALDRLGLARSHGVGLACLESEEILRLNDVSVLGVNERELRLLTEVGLQWGSRLGPVDRPLGVFFFGGQESSPHLELWVRHFLEAVVASTSVALRNLEMLDDYRNLSLVGVKGLVAALEAHHPRERGHAARVVRSSVIVGRALGLDDPSLRDLAVCAFLHDVGKLAANPVEERPGEPPSASPVDRRHPLVGSKILSHAKPMPAVIQGVEQHHERWDGHGFPYGLVRDGIHLYGRIVAIADAYDRCVHAVDDPVAPDEALRRLERGAGLLWDPGLVAVFASELGRSPNRAHPAVSDPWIEGIAAPR